MSIIIKILLFYLVSFATAFFEKLPPPCDSQIYCTGELLHTVQRSGIFRDSKTFVDRKIKHSVNETLNNFEDLMESTNRRPSNEQLLQFVEENTEEYDGMDNWIPPDFNPYPKFLRRIEDPELEHFAFTLVQLWSSLGRKIKAEVWENPEQYSAIPVPNGFIVPGGRFAEFYYWDTYWIVKGLLISEMYQTVKGILENFVSLIQRFGFIPNGGRIYYLNRSQPPLLTKMVASYIDSTDDTLWLKNNIKYLEEEQQYWLAKKTLQVARNGFLYTLAHYNAEFSGPRPESYSEDMQTAEMFTDEESRQNVYVELKSAAESGWDFSSRWIFDESGRNLGNLSNIQTSRVIPVDLNSVLCGNFRDLSYFYLKLGNVEKSAYWYNVFIQWRNAIKAVLYDEEKGIWFDYDSKLSKPRKYFHPSNIAPLWTRCIDEVRSPIFGKRAVEYLKTTGVLEYGGGTPASLHNTGEQWDFPNAWPPLQAILVHGLKISGDAEALLVAQNLAKTWIRANMIGYSATSEMFEKYDALNPGQYGAGGEYIVQSGFGWTNGVILDFIYTFF